LKLYEIISRFLAAVEIQSGQAWIVMKKRIQCYLDHEQPEAAYRLLEREKGMETTSNIRCERTLLLAICSIALRESEQGT
jgi:hypothetical protein